MNLIFVKDEHTFGKKMARNDSKMAILWVSQFYIKTEYILYHFKFLILPFFPLEMNSQKKQVAKGLSNWVTQANISESE